MLYMILSITISKAKDRSLYEKSRTIDQVNHKDYDLE